ncbi:MAG: LamB/YcsF family protein [Burkholderiaceae bacterium]
MEAQVKQLVEDSSVTTDVGEPISIQAESLCVHGDNPESVRVAQAVKDLLHPERP